MAICLIPTFIITKGKIDESFRVGSRLVHLQNIFSELKPVNADPDFIVNSVRTLLDAFIASKSQVYDFKVGNKRIIRFVNHPSLVNAILEGIDNAKTS